ncbi:hypothetical protein sscle_08g066460 [Sclerotinia sclerotiorum 1980 UF-70]|uniref:Pal1 cell morphology protein n=1 Tax=Sclerotinia sclerotiorum (strain ATCC 18683 / 1980 / Ss-1) TaxID=665079 RepID=A0A1D9QAD2_SCLS1|nr:hypothetical protein sscle_08g066460 [Sclerotinia sclerotiorum 1980 UF-70]
MSLSSIQPDYDGNRSPGLSTNLSSNNPFRNRAVSPAMSSSTQRAHREPPPRPLSRNPFLDSPATNQTSSPDKMAFSRTSPSSSGPALTGHAADLFDELTLGDKPVPDRSQKPGLMRSNTSANQQAENIPPGRPSGHRPMRSQEETMRARRPAGKPSSSKPRKEEELDIFADPSDSPKRRARRNSDTSIMDRKPRLLDPEDERRRLEKEKRHRDRKRAQDKTKKKAPLDVIDQLDATSIFGIGAFHHDGPFDACLPGRNRTGSRRAPMQAFAKDSANNSLGGGGPLNQKPDHATFMGNNDAEAHLDYSRGGDKVDNFQPYGHRPGMPSRTESAIESATSRVEPVHGEESMGLGTSTFLEGAPASRAAVQKNQNEQFGMDGGLSRKKSLAQKIRGINSRRDYGPSGRMNSPEGMYTSISPDGYTPGGSRANEANPFFNEFGKGDDTIKEEFVTFAELPPRPGRSRAPSNPPGIERRVTSDSMGESTKGSASNGGFLSRVKSLKGGPRKPRVENRPLPTQTSQLL